MTKECKEIYSLVSKYNKLGELKSLAKELKINHPLAEELWNITELYPRLLSVLIMDLKLLNQGYLELLVNDLEIHSVRDKNQILDWLLANKLVKSKRTIKLLISWEDSEYPSLRRLYWYYQSRLRWAGQAPPKNNLDLINKIEKKLKSETPEVQWAMNFCCGWIGIYDDELTARCIDLGNKLGLYKDEKVSKGCTPSYLPDFIRIERKKLGKD